MPDGMQVAYRILDRSSAGGQDRRAEPAVLLLHSTLSSGWQLKGLAWTISAWATVVLPDRRGSGASRLSEPRPVELPTQVSDAVALLDEMGVGRALVFGHSYGGVVALALAAAHPERVDAVIAYEPPLLDAVGPTELGSAVEVATLVRSAHAAGGAAAASRAFLHAIGGVDLLDGASSSTRAAVLAEGDGVLADVGAMGNARVALEDVVCPVVLVTGDDSEPFYRLIADAAAACLPHATRVRLPGLKHHAPITQPAAVAQLIRLQLERQAGSTSDRSASARSSRPS
jgi:pimeloyl-ACP methyl ester carboxylesterase